MTEQGNDRYWRQWFSIRGLASNPHQQNTRVGLLLVLSLLASAAPGATLTTLLYFGNNNGSFPFAGLIRASDGNFYGTTTATQPWEYYSGTVFKMAPSGQLTTLHFFATNGTADVTNNGFYPNAALVQGSDGALYGSTSGDQPGFGGTLFRITTNGLFTTLFKFNGANGDSPTSALIQGLDGNFYGATPYGGSGYTGAVQTGYGTVFRLGTNGNFATLHFFAGGNDGANPISSLVQASDGTLYGTASSGGINNKGTIYKMTTNGALTTLYSFQGIDGQTPLGGLVFGSGGFLYGTTEYGGAYTDRSGNGLGTIFKITTNGSFNSLLSFNGTNGARPMASMIAGADGNLYGTAATGGIQVDAAGYGPGTVFSMTPAGALTTIYFFSNSIDGQLPTCRLVQLPNGDFYGTTFEGYNYGTIFRLSLSLAPVFQKVVRSGASLLLTWTSVAGRTYQLQSTTNLPPTNWVNLGGPVLATNVTTTASDVVGPDRRRLYRVALLP